MFRSCCQHWLDSVNHYLWEVLWEPIPAQRCHHTAKLPVTDPIISFHFSIPCSGWVLFAALIPGQAFPGPSPLPSAASLGRRGWPSLLSLRRLPTTMVAQDRKSTSPMTTPATSSGDTSRLVSPPCSPALGKVLVALLWFQKIAGEREREKKKEMCH